MSTSLKDARPMVVPMVARAPEEAHRAATPLELFFDLVFVVAIAQAAEALHHSIVADHVGDGLLKYFLIFFAIWWAWMSFTWFASAFDTDDAPYRLAVFLQMTGALILAAGVKQAFDAFDFRVMAGGYVVMRIAIIIQYARMARNNPGLKKTAWRYITGIGIIQLGWVGMLFLPKSWILPVYFFFLFCELMIPIWAESASATPWHKHHISERYGLLTIIVLGESVLAAILALQAVNDAHELSWGLMPVLNSPYSAHGTRITR